MRFVRAIIHGQIAARRRHNWVPPACPPEQFSSDSDGRSGVPSPIHGMDATRRAWLDLQNGRHLEILLLGVESLAISCNRGGIDSRVNASCPVHAASHRVTDENLLHWFAGVQLSPVTEQTLRDMNQVNSLTAGRDGRHLGTEPKGHGTAPEPLILAQHSRELGPQYFAPTGGLIGSKHPRSHNTVTPRMRQQTSCSA